MTSVEHIEQYRHNAAIADYLCRRDIAALALDWVVTVRFYCAVHIIDSMITADMRRRVPREEKGGHNERNFIVQSEAPFNSVKKVYNELYLSSQGARYDGIKDVQFATRSAEILGVIERNLGVRR